NTSVGSSLGFRAPAPAFGASSRWSRDCGADRRSARASSTGETRTSRRRGSEKQLGRGGAAAHALLQPGQGEGPVALDGGGGDPEDLGRLLDLEPPESSQLYDACLRLVERGQRVERFVEGNEVQLARARRDEALVERPAYNRPAP